MVDRRRRRVCPSCGGQEPECYDGEARAAQDHGYSLGARIRGHAAGCDHDVALTDLGYPDAETRNRAHAASLQAFAEGLAQVLTDDPTTWPDWLTGAFKLATKATRLEVRCSSCSAGWAYPLGRAMSGAALLELLDHSIGHGPDVRLSVFDEQTGQMRSRERKPGGGGAS